MSHATVNSHSLFTGSIIASAVPNENSLATRIHAGFENAFLKASPVAREEKTSEGDTASDTWAYCI